MDAKQLYRRLSPTTLRLIIRDLEKAGKYRYRAQIAEAKKHYDKKEEQLRTLDTPTQRV